jgi:formylglycine-generating enzyme required for sulfatase activity
MDARPLKVFLCHTSADKPAVRDLYKRLVADGVDAWLDAESLIPGQNWWEEIQKAIRASDVVIVCLSEKSVNKEGVVQKEIKSALDVADEKPEETIFIIPARLEECKTPDRLSLYHWVDLYEEDGYQKLMRALRLRAGKIGAVLQSKKDWLNGFTAPVKKPAYKKPELAVKKPVSQPESPMPDAVKQSLRKFKTQATAATVGAVVIFLVISLAIFGLPWKQWFAAAPSVATATNTITFPPSQPTLTETSSILTFTSALSTETKTSTLAPTTTFLEEQIIDDKGITMRLVPVGTFMMGIKDGTDNPIHEIYLDSYYMDIYEVTNAAYKKCVDSGVCKLPSDTKYDSSTYTSKYGDPNYEQHPVVYVDWEMAKKYCEWRNARLPTEAEWEKAARGTDGRTYPWGEDVSCDKANAFSGSYCVGDTTPVGSYESGKSPYGMYDMAGNVLELVSDWFSETYYQNSPSSNPLGPDTGQYRVLRGGSWNVLDGRDFRSADRYYNDEPDGVGINIGFRCARSAP